MITPLVSLVLAFAGQASSVEPGSLPIRRVVLYKHGLGYFEREGRVSGDQTLSLAFKAGEMNDVLKSLTLLDLSGKGRISSVAYDSTRPLDRLLADYPFDLRSGNGTKGLAGLLPQLQGASLEVKLPSGVVRGLVLGVDTVTKKEGETSLPATILSLLEESGAMRKIDLSEVISLEPTDPRLKKDLAEYLGFLAASRRKDEKRLTIQATGDGERSIYASYTVESPVWKASYRAILPEKGAEDVNGGADAKKPLLQGWALVDNTSDEDWTDVALSLVSGRPVSFVLNIYDPRYKRRPTVEIEEEIAATPQTHEGAIATYKNPPATPAPAEKARAPIAGGAGGGDGGRDELRRRAYADASLGFANDPELRDAELKSLAEDAIRAAEPDAVAREIGDLFQYDIDDRVSIPKNRSALIPILSSPVEGERVDVYNAAARAANPLAALRFRNTSGLTLEGGPVTVLEGTTYAGEAILETLKPNETRFLSYAVDLGVKISSTFDSTTDRVTLVKIIQGAMIALRKNVSTRTYTIVNVGREKKIVWVEHPRRPDWSLRDGGAKPEESSESFHRFRVDVGPDSTARLAVAEDSPLEARYDVTNLTPELVDVFVSERLLSDEMRALLEKTLALRAEIARIDADKARADAERQALFANQERLRENLRALRDSSEEKELRSRYVARLASEEDAVAALDARVGALAERRAAATAELTRLVRDAALEFKP